MILTRMLGTLMERTLGPAATPVAAVDEVAGMVLIADGIGGLELCASNLARVLPMCPTAMQLHHLKWGHGLGRWFADLTDASNVDRQAGHAAEAVERFRARRPGAPVFLVGKSGGAGVVLQALRRLPSGSVERAVLLAPAVSPGYDLSKPLEAIRRELVVYYSPLDLALLGAGTWIFGTIDRVRGVGAGLVGFRPSGGVPPSGWEKVRQVRWRPEMLRAGYFGGHLAVDLPAFLRRYVVPLLAAEPGDCPEERPGPIAG